MIASAVFRRVAVEVVTLFGVAVGVFLLLRGAPGARLAMMIAPAASAHDIAELGARYGLDQPLLVQFGIWLDGILHGNFGISISLRRNGLELLIERLPAALELASGACELGGVIRG